MNYLRVFILLMELEDTNSLRPLRTNVLVIWQHTVSKGQFNDLSVRKNVNHMNSPFVAEY